MCLYNDFPDHADFEQVCVRNDSYVDFEHVCVSVLSSQCSLTQRLTYVLPGFTVVYVCVRARCTLARALALALFALSLFLSLRLSLSLSHTHTHTLLLLLLTNILGVEQVYVLSRQLSGSYAYF